MNLFEKPVINRLLTFFCLNPNTELNLGEISRKLNISKSSIKQSADFLEKETILNSQKVGNQKIFYLNNQYFLINDLKKIIALLNFKKNGIESISKNELCLAIFGSFANGTFNENSDLDILIIGNKNDILEPQLSKFTNSIKNEIQLVIYDFPVWEKMKKENNPFCESVLKKHILIKGGKL
jgi:uncharacterized protein